MGEVATTGLDRMKKPMRMILALWLTGLGAGCSTIPAGPPTVSSTAATGAKSYVWSRSMERKRAALEEASRGSGIAVLRMPDNQLQVNVPSDFSFDSDSAVIKPGMRPVLDAFAVDLEATELSGMLILVVGHTDDRGSDALNDPLSLARASSVAAYLESKGIGAGRITVDGRGDHAPMIGNDRAYGRALNRRVEIFLREPAA